MTGEIQSLVSSTELLLDLCRPNKGRRKDMALSVALWLDMHTLRLTLAAVNDDS